MDFAVEAPINPVSFGNCSYNILLEFFKKGLSPNLFLIGDKADVSCFNKIEKDFVDWIQMCASKAQAKHSRDIPGFKLWHINGSLTSFFNSQSLLTFYELDSPTKFELNVLNNQKNVLVSSSYTKDVFESFSVKNVTHCPLGFDSIHFEKVNRKYNEGQITFGLAGKLEKRKQHHKVLSAWAKKYGDNPKYVLNCAIQNPFLSAEQQSSALVNILKRKYFNINFISFMPTNSAYNDYLNSNDIMIGMSAGEGWGLPEFQSLCLGKHGVILNAHAYKDWANKENAVLVNPSGKIKAYDGVFFNEGSPFNQGNYFDWDEDEFISACEEAEKRLESSPVNTEGEKLAKKFTWKNTAEIILDTLKN